MLAQGQDSEGAVAASADRRKPTAQERGLHITAVRIDGKKTSISLDAGLWGLLVRILGDAASADRWLVEQAQRLDVLSRTRAGVENAAGAGLSRLVQREAYRLIERELTK